LAFASRTVAVATDVDVPFATIDEGFSVTATLAGAPGACVNIACPLADPSAALIVADPAVVVDVIVAEYVPSPLFVTAPICCAPVLENDTESAFSRLPFASFTVAVAVAVDVPSAVIDFGLKATETLAAGPAVCVNF
jgi:hypothetical protein